MLTVRPFNEDGTWGVKAKREYKYDEQGNHILDKNGKNLFIKEQRIGIKKKYSITEESSGQIRLTYI
jgi:MobA/MobL family